MEALHAQMQKQAIEKVKKSRISGFPQWNFLGIKTQQQMETKTRSEFTEHISEVRLKMETPESIRSSLEEGE